MHVFLFAFWGNQEDRSHNSILPLYLSVVKFVLGLFRQNMLNLKFLSSPSSHFIRIVEKRIRRLAHIMH